MTTPYPLPSPLPPRRRRRRPSAWWFAVGGLLAVAGIAVFGVILVSTIHSFARVDAHVVADGRPHDLTLADTGDERMVWGPALSTDCTIVDRTTGEDVDYEPLSASYDKTVNGTHYVGVVKFDPASGRLRISCQDAGGPVEVGPVPHLQDFAGGIIGSIAALLVLLGGGIVVLLVTTVLFIIGEPRRPRIA